MEGLQPTRGNCQLFEKTKPLSITIIKNDDSKKLKLLYYTWLSIYQREFIYLKTLKARPPLPLGQTSKQRLKDA